MSGKIEFCIRKSPEKNKHAFISGYPGWTWKVYGENSISHEDEKGQFVVLMPRKSEVCKILQDIITHEWSIDHWFSRKPDVNRWVTRFNTVIKNSQLNLYPYELKDVIAYFLERNSYGSMKTLEELLNETKSE